MELRFQSLVDPGPAGCLLIVPSGCNTAMGGACKLTKDPKDGTVWNEVCIRYADEKEGTLGDVIDILTDKEKKDCRAKFKTQKDAWEGHVCADADPTSLNGNAGSVHPIHLCRFRLG